MSEISVPRIVVCGRDPARIQDALVRTDEWEVRVSMLGEEAALPSAASVEEADALIWGGGSAHRLQAGPPSMRDYACPVVVVSDDGSEEATLGLLREGAAEVVVGPSTDAGLGDELRAAVRRAMARDQSAGAGHAGEEPEASLDRRLARAVHSSQLLILLTDAEGRIEYVNPQWCAQTGYLPEQAIGKNPRILKSGKMAAIDYERLWKRISSGEVWHGHLVNRRADGTEYAEQIAITPVSVGGATRHYLHVGVDATDSVGRDDILERAKRFRTLGLAMGGLAHEFNNIFGVILANASLAAAAIERSGAPAATLQALQDVLEETEKGRTVVRRLLMYTGRWRIQPQPTDLFDEVVTWREGFSESLPPGITLEVRDEEAARTTAAIDREGFGEVLEELVTTASKGMTTGGRIEIRVGRRVVDDAFTQRYPWARTGSFASIRVVDEGGGMDAETIEGLFDLLSGDKLQAGITGLGLAMTYGFVKLHAGFIVADSAPGHGTTIELLFPVSTDRPTDPHAPFPTEGTPSPDDRHEVKKLGVLYAEDNARLRRVGVRVLTRAGFRTFEAEDGRQAFDILTAHAGEIDLVLSDLVMPDLDGKELYALVQTLDDPPAFLFTTAHADAAGSAGAGLPSGVPYVLKPWSGEQLIEAIERALAVA